MESKRIWVSSVAALLTSAVMGPSSRSVVSNRLTTSGSELISALTAMAFPPLLSISCTTDAAANSFWR